MHTQIVLTHPDELQRVFDICVSVPGVIRYLCDQGRRVGGRGCVGAVECCAKRTSTTAPAECEVSEGYREERSEVGDGYRPVGPGPKAVHGSWGTGNAMGV